MNENINLCEILKGHEGEIFYSKVHGNVKFIGIQETTKYDKNIICAYVSSINNYEYHCIFLTNGKINHAGEIMLFPSKDQKDWIKWDKENNDKTPKTWSELIERYKVKKYGLSFEDKYSLHTIANSEPIEKSVLALLKIHQLIEAGYGRNVTNEEWENDYWKYVIGYYTDDKEFPIKSRHDKSLIAFHTKEQAKKFLSYPENIQLLKDYFMIND